MKEVIRIVEFAVASVMLIHCDIPNFEVIVELKGPSIDLGALGQRNVSKR